MSAIDWSRLPPLSTLRAFEATARLQSYSAAARALNVTPAAIAQQVRKLETEIDAPLVRREGRGIVLTDAGHQLARPLSEAFRMISDGVEDTRRREVTRGVRVSTTQFFVDAVILPRLSEFWAENPSVEVAFSPEGGQQPVDLENFDICVRADHRDMAWPGTNWHELLPSRVSVYAAPALLERAGGDLTSLPWIYEHTMGEEHMREFVTLAGFDWDRIRIVDPGSGRLEIEAAVSGLGLTLSTDLVVRRQVREGALVRVETPLDIVGTYWAVYRKGPLAPPVRHFLDWLTAISADVAAA